MSDIRSFFIRHDGCCARVAVCLSGTGSNADVLLASAGSAGTSFKAVVLFTDAPESSRAVELGRKYNIPVESLDIRKFYAGHGEDDIRLNSDRRRQLRDQWSEKVWEILQKYRCDFAVFAGFMPLTNLAEKLPCLNVHPGDLTMEKDGQRIYAGLHYKPVERAILNGEKRFDAISAREIYPAMNFLPNTQWGYAPCLCGRKCDIACYKHLVGEL